MTKLCLEGAIKERKLTKSKINLSTTVPEMPQARKDLRAGNVSSLDTAPSEQLSSNPVVALFLQELYTVFPAAAPNRHFEIPLLQGARQVTPYEHAGLSLALWLDAREPVRR